MSTHRSLRDLSIGSATVTAIAVAGMAIHNAVEFGPGFLLDLQTLIPVAIFASLAWACRGSRPRTPMLMLLVAGRSSTSLSEASSRCFPCRSSRSPRSHP